ncbi:MAG TPA: cytochrome c peroxidase [Candidatus Limnocylindrales bacterium]|nr:cytochrome c peroxidase [Candidatus Limnocylindrales bacterium]
MRRHLTAWLPLYLFLALVGILVGARPALVRETLRAAWSRGAPAAVPSHARDSATVALGRALFFDPVLSANRDRACASCHMPTRGLADGRRFSQAVDHTNLPRGAPALVNVSDQTAFFWDGRAVSLEDQIDGPVHSGREMGGLPPRAVEGRLDSIASYRELFESAFGHGRPRYADARHAIAAFERTLQSKGSTVDRWWRGESDAVPAEVRRGMDLFAGKARCSRCHFLPLTTSVVPGAFDEQEFTVIGVPYDSAGTALDPDLGRFIITRRPQDRRAFKAPSLRGIALSAPYMHNGVFATLEQVVRFYNRGGGRGLGLDVPNQAPEVRPLHLTLEEEHALVSFLKALSDDSALVVAPAHVPSGLKVGGAY